MAIIQTYARRPGEPVDVLEKRMIDRPMTLVLDALFCAMKLNRILAEAKQYGSKEHFLRVDIITGKAWDRYDRRAEHVSGLKAVRKGE